MMDGASPLAVLLAAALLGGGSLQGVSAQPVLLVQYAPATGLHFAREALAASYCNPNLICGPIQWGDGFATVVSGAGLLPLLWTASNTQDPTMFINFTISGNPTTEFAITSMSIDR